MTKTVRNSLQIAGIVAAIAASEYYFFRAPD
ncbi:MAG: hypothetical protein K0Q72_4409, partial [Armatimonadetes bacterium]|nr:hypothetical protein [Armatimonadota bacterium]